MKTRIQFTLVNPGDAVQAAKEYQTQHGGRVVLQEQYLFDTWWVKAVYWYSPDYIPSEIFNDLHGRVEIL